jgi:hypothetical protein
MVAVLQQLPCPNLLELIMHSGRVQLGAADGYPGVIQCCTKLTRFELWWSNIGIPKGGVLDGLSSLVHLQHLVMLPDNILGGYSVATLPRLQHLMYLGAGSFSTQNLLQLSGLTKLQELNIVPFRHPRGHVEDTVGPKSVHGLALPALLQRLGLSVPVELAFLSLPPVGLQSLSVSDGMWRPNEKGLVFCCPASIGCSI